MGRPGLDESHVAGNLFKTGRLRQIRIQEINEIGIEMAIVDSDMNPIWFVGRIPKYISKVRYSGKPVETFVFG